MNRVCMWWHSCCSSLIFKSPFSVPHSPAEEDITFWSLFQALCPLFQSGTLPRLCPGCLDKVHLLCLHHTEYSTSSESKAIKKPRMVRNITLLAVSTRPHAPPSITVVVCSEGWGVVFVPGVVVVVLLGGRGAGVTATGARESTMGRANAETTMPVVRNQASSRHGFDPDESSPLLLAIRVGIGDIR